METDETGVIIDISRDFSVVSIASVSKKFLFNKAIFFAFGVRCEGYLDNILEIGMEVNLSYKFSRQQNKPYLTAVWLGNKPRNFVANGTGLKAIYSQTGRVEHILGDTIFVQCDESHHRVLISKRLVFQDGQSVDKDNEPEITFGERITFDAVPFEWRNGLLLYEATCAWLGAKEPRLVDRFNLRTNDEDEAEEFPQENIFGTVAVIPNDTVAVIDVRSEFALVKVVLFRSSLEERCERIKDILAVGDTLSLRLRSGYIFPERKQWFVTKAWKHCVEIKTDESETFSCVTQAAERSKDGVKRYGDITETGLQAVNLGSEVTRTTEIRETDAVVSRVCSLERPLSSTGVSKKLNRSEGSKAVVKRDGDITETGLNAVNSADVLVTQAAEGPKDGVKRDGDITETGLQAVNLGSEVTRTTEIPETDAVMSKVCSLERPPSSTDTSKRVKRPDGCSQTSSRLGKTSMDMHPASTEAGEKPAVSHQPCGRNIKAVKNDVKATQDDTVKSGKGVTTKAVRSDTDVHQPGNPKSLVLCDKKGPSNEVWQPFKSAVLPSKRRQLLLNFSGTVRVLRVKSKQIGVIIEFSYRENVESSQGKPTDAKTCKRVSSALHHPVFNGTSGLIGSESLSRFHGSSVQFDGELLPEGADDEFFCVKRMWLRESRRPSPEYCLTSELRYEGSVTFRPTEIYRATITSIPLHDCAVALVDDVPVLLPFDSLVIAEKVNTSYTCIDEFLQEGEVVSLNIKRETLPDGKGVHYFKAVKCGKSVSYNVEKLDAVLDNVSWMTMWGMGEFDIVGLVKQKGDKYYVDFVPSESAGLNLQLDIFAKGRISIDGISTTRKKAGNLGGCEITFHVAYSRQEELKDPSTHGFYVACAWIGNEPPSLAMLKDGAFKNVVCSNSLYEGIIEDFPLPTHAICRVGICRVLVPLGIVDKDVFDITETHLSKGDRVTIRVVEKRINSGLFLVSTEVPKPMGSSCNVFSCLMGRISQLPYPRGEIHVSGLNIKVRFEICNIAMARKEVLPNIDRFISSLDGKEVYVTAVYVTETVNTMKPPYRALKVWMKC